MLIQQDKEWEYVSVEKNTLIFINILNEFKKLAFIINTIIEERDMIKLYKKIEY